MAFFMWIWYPRWLPPQYLDFYFVAGSWTHTLLWYNNAHFVYMYSLLLFIYQVIQNMKNTFLLKQIQQLNIGVQPWMRYCQNWSKMYAIDVNLAVLKIHVSYCCEPYFVKISAMIVILALLKHCLVWALIIVFCARFSLWFFESRNKKVW